MTLYRENKLLNTGVQAHNGHFFASGHCLTSSVCEESITLFFFTLRECNKKDSEPKEPVVGMIDGALEAAQALVNVWPNIRVELCVWHVSRAWSRALQKKKWEDRTKMTDVLKDAESIMYKMDISERDTSLEEFRRRWASEQDVLAYFEAGVFPQEQASSMVPETGGCPCYYARRFFGKVYCKHEALLCFRFHCDSGTNKCMQTSVPGPWGNKCKKSVKLAREMLSGGAVPFQIPEHPNLWSVPSSKEGNSYTVPETGGCPCYYARRFFGKVYCKHEALLCLFLRKDPKALLPECSRPWIPSTVEMDGVREGSGNQPLCSVLTDSERMSVPAMPETSEASVSQHKGMFDHCHFNALQKPNDGCVW
eukprot:CAMPEP_0184672244 /NCGR_PEP_ID=MMETSP0308-20130426/85987_1 /TAXON_ID=38269 /ORGANISM="Gloeochaete witrockiana, Strain SAG 46.84" /LENGTH=364 /DNA_ID=CAMNT_0027119537 /DNA_START=405 /DNA_END=1496 /DNA_ORIENTATION=+